MISKATIDNIFSTMRIEDIIGEYVQLKRAGANLKGLSPFQDEKTPSFVVSPSRQIWKDFSSGKGGNAISFLMESNNDSNQKRNFSTTYTRSPMSFSKIAFGKRKKGELSGKVTSTKELYGKRLSKNFNSDILPSREMPLRNMLSVRVIRRIF